MTTTESDGDHRSVVPIVGAKLGVPRLDPSVVDRRTLAQAWQDASDTQIVVVVAGAGWGKTVAMADRVRDSTTPCAWLSIDAADNDERRFWAHLCAAIERATGSDGLFPIMQQAQANGVDALIVELERAEPLTIVLDDLHHLVDRRLMDQIKRFLQLLPANVCMVVAARHLPGIGVARLRAKGRLIRISETELALSLSETRELVERVIPGADDLCAARLFDIASGWPIGTQLALDGALDTADPEHRLLQLEPVDADIGEFLLEEVFAHLDTATRQFVVETSILDRLIPSACVAVTGRADAGEVLRELVKARCFITELSTVSTEFRYHDMFRAFAQRQLELAHADAAQLRVRAALAAEQRGDVVAAINHYARADDHENTIRLLLPNLAAHMVYGDLSELWAWWDRAPIPAFDDESPDLALLWMLELNKQDRRFDQRLQELRSRITGADAGSRSEAAQLDIAEAYHAFRRGRIEQANTLAAAVASLDLETPGSPDSHYIGSFVLARTSLLLGDVDRCERIVATSLDYSDEYLHHEPSRKVTEAWLALEQASPDEALAAARRSCEGEQLSTHWSNPIDATLAHGAALQLNGYDAAARRLCEEALHRAQINEQPLFEVLALTQLAALSAESGDDDDATRSTARARRLIRTHRMSPSLLPCLDTIERSVRSRSSIPVLTEREIEVLDFLPSRLTRNDIAEQLHISPHTVHHHSKSLYSKLRVSNRDDAVRVARLHRLLATAEE